MVILFGTKNCIDYHASIIKKNSNLRKQILKQEHGISTKHVTEIMENPENRELLQCSVVMFVTYFQQPPHLNN